MKIIGVVERARFICEIDRNEIECIVGLDPGNLGGLDQSHTAKLHIGVEVDILSRFDRLREMERARDRLDQAIKQIRAVATVLEPLADVVKFPEEPKADSE